MDGVLRFAWWWVEVSCETVINSNISQYVQCDVKSTINYSITQKYTSIIVRRAGGAMIIRFDQGKVVTAQAGCQRR